MAALKLAFGIQTIISQSTASGKLKLSCKKSWPICGQFNFAPTVIMGNF